MTTSRAVVLVTALLVTVVAANGEPHDAAPVFEEDVLPILKQHCLECHGLEAREAGLDLRTATLLKRGSDNGPILANGSPDESLLLERVADRSMPPEGELPLTDAKIETIRRWIAAGAAARDEDNDVALAAPPSVSAEDRQFWSFRRLKRLSPPEIADRDKARTPVDAFLLRELTRRGLTFSPVADRAVLVRRVSFDLIGLPPSPETLARYADDDSPDAYERMLDELLASPHFGERWGRHWLDVVGYVDTVGADNDAAIILVADGKWRYRDYVVQSFNADQPFNQFVIEQLAGDELDDWRSADRYTPRMRKRLIATGYLRNVADRTAEDELNTADIRVSVLYDTMELIGTNLLGLTLQCARCHSHKYEPISQRDYYRMMALFTPAFNVQSWLQPHYRDGTERKERYRELPDVSLAEQKHIDAHNATIEQQISEQQAAIKAVRQECRERLEEARLAAIPEPIRADTKAALKTPKDDRSELQQYLAERLGGMLAISDEQIDSALSEPARESIDESQRRIGELTALRQSYGKIQALYDVGPPPDTHVFRRGNHATPAAPVEPGFLAVLCEEGAASLAEQWPQAPSTSGRRLALARWLTDAESRAGALVARVMVNRIWAHLFGEGLAPTPGNFGRSGAEPTHPELLDWLARRFVEGGWRVKPIIKLLMTSAAYRQMSEPPPRGATASNHLADTAGAAAAKNPWKVDPGNRLLWRMRLRRLESEAIRDAVLAASGTLSVEFGGPPLLLDPRPDGSVVLKEDALRDPRDRGRRSLYVLARRAYHLSLLDVFDQPIIATNCTRRSSSAVVTQSLAMLNDEFLFDQARHFANRVERESPDDSPRAHAELAFQIALGRLPDADETQWSLQLLAEQQRRYRDEATNAGTPQQQALASLCHMLLNSSEYLYIP